ncbi:uncharacterized protein BP5553_00974 [Venustampulla echinocandica]|uniref:Uncharacterized protein n=1 Tax=Venustampulla echinocandica TaxID=2656787 RepID=A0A370TZP6_9HELO|nr:uncharacterized protein BP5553_00974 [Venustampulla echinocandica]RDL40995.1 hypothetical protein BP5553_00974 [Venustampulla echinocandica]
MAAGNARSIFDGAKAAIWPPTGSGLRNMLGVEQAMGGDEAVQQPITGRAEVHHGKPAAGIPWLPATAPAASSRAALAGGNAVSRTGTASATRI